MCRISTHSSLHCALNLPSRAGQLNSATCKQGQGSVSFFYHFLRSGVVVRCGHYSISFHTHVPREAQHCAEADIPTVSHRRRPERKKETDKIKRAEMARYQNKPATAKPSLLPPLRTLGPDCAVSCIPHSAILLLRDDWRWVRLPTVLVTFQVFPLPFVSPGLPGRPLSLLDRYCTYTDPPWASMNQRDTWRNFGQYQQQTHRAASSSPVAPWLAIAFVWTPAVANLKSTRGGGFSLYHLFTCNMATSIATAQLPGVPPTSVFPMSLYCWSVTNTAKRCVTRMPCAKLWVYRGALSQDIADQQDGPSVRQRHTTFHDSPRRKTHVGCKSNSLLPPLPTATSFGKACGVTK